MCYKYDFDYPEGKEKKSSLNILKRGKNDLNFPLYLVLFKFLAH